MTTKRVLLGMSGGTDSSVAAMLLQEKGYRVVGLTLRLWNEQDDLNSDKLPNYLKEARHLASQLGIEHHVMDVRIQFYDDIINYFKNTYLQGLTPNPCARCNVTLKWKMLVEQANKLNCEYVSTGHYVQVQQKNNKYYIHKGLDPDKEQSFFLWGLGQDILKRTIFPLGKMYKHEVKQYAEKRGFRQIAQKKESIGVCFIQGRSYQPFLEKLLREKKQLPGKGWFVNSQGEVLGEHKGFPFYTVGQRRGLGLEPTEPWYVTDIDAKTNRISLGKRQDLYQKEMIVKNYNIIDENDFASDVITRIRYRKQSAVSRVSVLDNRRLRVVFNEPEWSIAPGQTAAFYNGNRLLGGGFIEK